MPPKKELKKTPPATQSATLPMTGEEMAQRYDSFNDSFEEIETATYLKVLEAEKIPDFDTKTSPEKTNFIDEIEKLQSRLAILTNLIDMTFNKQCMAAEGLSLIANLQIKILSLRHFITDLFYQNTPGIDRALDEFLKKINSCYEEYHHFYQNDPQTEKYIFLTFLASLQRNPNNQIKILKKIINNTNNHLLAMHFLALLIETLLFILKITNIKSLQQTEEYIKQLEIKLKSAGEEKNSFLYKLILLFFKIFKSHVTHSPETQKKLKTNPISLAEAKYKAWETSLTTETITTLKSARTALRDAKNPKSEFFTISVLGERYLIKRLFEVYRAEMEVLLRNIDTALNTPIYVKLLESIKGLTIQQIKIEITTNQELHAAVTTKEWQQYLSLLRAKEIVLNHLLQLTDIIPTDTLSKDFLTTEIETVKKIIGIFELTAIALEELKQERIKETERYIAQLEQESKMKEKYLALKKNLREKKLPPTATTQSSAKNSNISVFFQRNPQQEVASSQNKNISAEQHDLLTTAFQKIRDQNFPAAIKLYETIIAKYKPSKTTIFVLIHAAWEIANCEKIQANFLKNHRKSYQRAKQKIQARYKKALEYISQAIAMFSDEKNCDELHTLEIYAELINGEIEENREQQQTSALEAHKNFDHEHGHSRTRKTKKPLEANTTPPPPNTDNGHALSILKRTKPRARIIKDEHVQKILDILIDAGLTIHIFGGAVRDYKLNRTPKDYDINIATTTQNVINILRKSNIAFHILGKKYPLIVILLPNTWIEIPCRDSYQTHSSYEKTLNPVGHDFTINSSYYNVATNEILYFEEAKSDFAKRVVAMFPGEDIENRFTEDPTLLFRAIYFASKLNFSIDPEMDKAFSIYYKNILPNLDSHTKNRIFVAVLKMFTGGFATTAIKNLQQHPNLITRNERSFYMLALLASDIDKKANIHESFSLPLLFATLLWQPLEEGVNKLQENNELEHDKVHQIINNILENSDIGIPLDPIPNETRKIWITCLRDIFPSLKMDIQPTRKRSDEEAMDFILYTDAKQLFGMYQKAQLQCLQPSQQPQASMHTLR